MFVETVVNPSYKEGGSPSETEGVKVHVYNTHPVTLRVIPLSMRGINKEGGSLVRQVVVKNTFTFQ
jgi:hypothetical protein